MNLLSTALLWVGGLLVGLGIGATIGFRSGHDYRRVSAPVSPSVARTETPHVNCGSSPVPLTEQGSGQTISGTWTGFSATETSLSRDSDERERGETPRGFRGEDLSDDEVEEWLRKWRL